jgi:hypothetical protein
VRSASFRDSFASCSRALAPCMSERIDQSSGGPTPERFVAPIVELISPILGMQATHLAQLGNQIINMNQVSVFNTHVD